jgi:hypothetical protein
MSSRSRSLQTPVKQQPPQLCSGLLLLAAAVQLMQPLTVLVVGILH